MPARIRTFRNANTPAPLKLPKGKLIKIEFGEHEQEIRESGKENHLPS
ncbi:MAG: hypothetical protein QOK79_07675 [Nitrososphaeraceae archaeon]|nr:hypothetical protein [Nitrososphaeraceae archaeon]MDW0199750.1 hypothetical protein [Nitrososphaeraceae archaeon]MDW3614473.1 hypothetical protein [Nitrososphaeraceae archaeon]